MYSWTRARVRISRRRGVVYMQLTWTTHYVKMWRESTSLIVKTLSFATLISYAFFMIYVLSGFFFVTVVLKKATFYQICIKLSLEKSFSERCRKIIIKGESLRDC